MGDLFTSGMTSHKKSSGSNLWGTCLLDVNQHILSIDLDKAVISKDKYVPNNCQGTVKLTGNLAGG